jgi:hypothetical protein
LLTHWHTKQTIACLGENRCPPAVHRSQSVWKGYAPAEIWEGSEELYIPCVMEVTEALDHMLSGRKLRGEVWMLSRPEGGKKSPVVGVYSQTDQESWLRPAFSILPVLERVYHRAALVVGVANPVPRPVFLEPCEGVQPKLLTELTSPNPVDHHAEKQNKEAIKEQLSKMRKMFGSRRHDESIGIEPGQAASNGRQGHQ